MTCRWFHRAKLSAVEMGRERRDEAAGSPSFGSAHSSRRAELMHCRARCRALVFACYWLRFSYCLMTEFEMRPRLETSMPCDCAHRRMAC